MPVHKKQTKAARRRYSPEFKTEPLGLAEQVGVAGAGTVRADNNISFGAMVVCNGCMKLIKTDEFANCADENMAKVKLDFFTSGKKTLAETIDKRPMVHTYRPKCSANSNQDENNKTCCLVQVYEKCWDSPLKDAGLITD